MLTFTTHFNLIFTNMNQNVMCITESLSPSHLYLPVNSHKSMEHLHRTIFVSMLHLFNAPRLTPLHICCYQITTIYPELVSYTILSMHFMTNNTAIHHPLFMCNTTSILALL